MRILFDQATPVGIRPFLKGHVIKTAFQQGWDRFTNGELLRLAEEAGFDLLLTPDKNMAYKQNLNNRVIAILVLGNGRWSNVKRYIDHIIAAIDSARPGTYGMIDMPDIA